MITPLFLSLNFENLGKKWNKWAFIFLTLFDQSTWKDDKIKKLKYLPTLSVGVQTDKVSVENNPERIISETINLFQSKAPKWARFDTPRNYAMLRSQEILGLKFRGITLYPPYKEFRPRNSESNQGQSQEQHDQSHNLGKKVVTLHQFIPKRNQEENSILNRDLIT